ncbi:hypothetical protein J437_LFUL001592 [Ladona fulva]|uniref:PHD-type domain-containing protein n=1 Tax=Ladona fulva TaxID=123851 RepID=A0A8K0KPU1_LADFU|nr:hypothetical protein J437_LFUL001592 [Ladona fulva]
MHCIGVEESRPGIDARRCLFCHVRGDADVEREGRLLLASSFGDWVHCNCALWSAEVYEEKGGLLMKVREAVNRGRRVRCALCRETGATLGCCLRGCPDSFHLGCAFRSGCLLLEDKSVYCRNHIPADKAKESNVEMSLKRPVQVDTEGRKGSVLWRWKKPGRAKRKPGDNGTTFAAGSLKFTVGSLHVECLGKIVPGNVQGQFIRPPEGKKSDNEGEMRWCEGGVSLAKKEEKDSKVPEMMAYGGPVVVPVGFRCTRLYWSSVEPWKVIEYNIQTVLVISETDEAQLAVTEEIEEKQNEEHDFHAHVTVDHTAEAEDDSRGAEQTDLIIPSDNELVKDLSSDFFTSKKLMQSIVGLLKGANHGEIQNGVPHHTFEVGEDGKTQKNLSDKENSISPNGSSLSDQNIQVPRHNKPMNVVQPVSKETLLTTESASRAWELTCEMRAAQTPPPSASPTMAGAAGNTSGITSIIKSQNKPEIWSEGSKELWKHLRPISQLDGNADPSSSSSEGGGSSPVRSSPSREPDQALPCLLACRIKQQSLARSEPGGGGPVKCKDCRRTYRTREGYERHLCGTPLPLSSTSSDSDSEDRTSRRVSSESDVPNISEDTVPQANDMYECYNEFSGKEKTLDENLNTKTDDDHTSCLIDNAAFNKDCLAEKFSPISNEEISVNHTALNATETCQSKVVATASFDSNPIEDGALMGDESQNVETNCSSSDQSKELNNHSGENDTIYPSEDDTSAMNSTKSGALDSNCSNSVSSENVGKNTAKNTLSNLVQGTKEVREGVWKGSTSDACTNKSTKRQMAKVQPVCYVNGTRRIQSAELLGASKAARLAISQEETLICNNQQINQGGIPQTSIITTPIQPQGAGNFQVLVRQLPSSSAVPQFAENFRQQTGHTLQYLATIDPNTFTQPGPLTQSQNLVGLIQGAPQIMQTQTLVSSQQVVASSPIMLAPQQQAIVYNPVTACIEALPPQQPNYILTPSTYTIPVSTPLSYGIPQEVPQVYFQSTAQPTVTSQPQAPQLEPVIQNEVGWTLPSGYHIVQNHPVEQHPQTIIQPQQLPQVAASSVPSTMEEEPLSGPVAQLLTVPIQSSPSTAKKKRILLPNNKVREGYMAYRRDERTGKYIPVEEGWEESLGLPIQKKVIEDGGVRSGLSPAVFPVEGKDCSSKDGRKRPIARKGDGVNVQGAESVDSQGSPKRWVRAKLTSQFRSPSNSACDSFEPIADPTNPNFGVVNRTRSAVEQVSLRTERVPKRIESASVMYQIRSADGLTIQSDSPDKMWNQVFNSVQESRVAYGLAPLPRNPFAPIYGSKPFMGAETLALSHKGLRYLLNQLPGASQLLETKQSAPEVPSVAPPPHKLFSRAHLSLSTQTPVEETPSIPPPPSSPPLPENPSGCARTEAYKMPPPFPGGHSSAMGNRKWRHRDIFGWLASPHRKLPMAPLPTQDSEPNGGGNR